MDTAHLHIISGVTEEERRRKIFSFLKKEEIRTEQIYYLTLNRRKIKYITEAFKKEFSAGTWLPTIRTLRGFFDFLLEKYRPDVRIIDKNERHFILRQLANASEFKLTNTALISDMEETIRLSGQYGLNWSTLQSEKDDLSRIITRMWQTYDNHLNSIHAMDYAQAPYIFFQSTQIPEVEWKNKYLILDGFYWLYPVEQLIMNHLLSLFGTVVWIEDLLLAEPHREQTTSCHLPEKIALKLRQTSIKDVPIPDISSLLSNSSSQVQFYHSPTPMGEVRQLTAQILNLLKMGKLRAEDITVVYMSTEYLPYIEYLFRYHGIPYDSGRGRSLLSLPIYSYFTTFLSLPLEDFPIKKLILLLKLFQKGPINKIPSCLQWSSNEIEIFEEWCRWTHIQKAKQLDFSFDPELWIGSLEDGDFEFLPESWTVFWEEGSHLEKAIDYLKSALQKVKQLIAMFPLQEISYHFWGYFVETSFSYFKAIDAFQESLKRTQTTYRNILKSIHKLVYTLPDKPQNYGEWLEITIHLLSQSEVRDERGSGIRVLEKLEPRGLSGNRLFVLGVSRHNLPGRMNYPEIFRRLIIKKQEIHQDIQLFPSDLEANYLLQHFILNYKSVTYSWPQQAQGQATGPSPQFMKWFAERWEREKGETDYSAEQLITYCAQKSQSHSTTPAIFADTFSPEYKDLTEKRNNIIYWRQQNATERQHVYNGQIGISEEWKILANKLTRTYEERIWSASSLDTLSLCPLKFYFRYGLHLEPPNTDNGNLYKRLLGRLIHRIFENVYKDSDILSLRKAGKEISENHPALQKALEQAFSSMQRIMEHTHPFARPILDGLKERFKRQQFMTLWIQADNRLVCQYSEVLQDVQTEVELQTEIEEIPLKIRGRIDRIDSLPNKIRFYDYKSGGSASGYSQRQRMGLYWQFILYRLLQEHNSPSSSECPIGFIFSSQIKKSQIAGILNQKDFTTFFQSFSSIKPIIIKRLFKLMQLIQKAHFYSSVLTVEDAYCKTCNFKQLCYRSDGYSLKDYRNLYRQDQLNSASQNSEFPVCLPIPIEPAEGNEPCF